MGWFTFFVLYTLIWWVVLFAVLPLGVQPQHEADAHTGWRGAPLRPRMGRKLLITTGVALLIWGACIALIDSPLLSFRHGWLALPGET